MIFLPLLLPIVFAMGVGTGVYAPAILTPPTPAKADLIQVGDVTPPSAQSLNCKIREISHDTIKSNGGYERVALGEAAKTVWLNSEDNTVPDAMTYGWNVDWRNDVVMYDRAGRYPKFAADWVGNSSDNAILRVCTLTPR